MKLQISAKCSDMCNVILEDDKGEILAERDGYVPKFMPEDHYGDYIILDIDPGTGQILNWKKNLTTKQMIEDLKE